MQKEDLVGRIRDVVSGIFDENKIELVDLTYRKEGNVRVLRILADAEGGITVDECARLNEVVGEALDREYVISDKYVLEVSSPGLDRQLRTKRDFVRVKGKKVIVYTYAPVDGRKEFNGFLEAVDDGGITVSEEDRGPAQIPFDKISKATLDCKSLMKP